MRFMAAVALIGMLAAGSARAASPGTFYLRGFAGYTTQTLDDVNDDATYTENVLSFIAPGADWGQFGGAGQYGVEAGYQLSPVVSLGFGIAHQTSSVDRSADVDFFDPNSGTTITGVLAEEAELRVLDVYATMAWWAPRTGLHLGGQVGVARGTYELQDVTDLTATDGSFAVIEGSGEADGTALSAGVFAGYEAALTPVLGISGRIGYRFLLFDELEGDYTSAGTTDQGPVFDSSSGPVTDFDGSPLEFDLSGIHASAALTFRFGAREY